MSEVNGVKVLLLILERYYMRNGSMAVSTVQIIYSGEVQQATIIGTGGGEGLMNISLGANQDFARGSPRFWRSSALRKSDLVLRRDKRCTFMS